MLLIVNHVFMLSVGVPVNTHFVPLYYLVKHCKMSFNLFVWYRIMSNKSKLEPPASFIQIKCVSRQ